jgi:hypothetical protein
VVVVLKIDDLSDAEVDGGDALDEAAVREVIEEFLWGGGGGGIRRLDAVDDVLGILASGGTGLRGGDEIAVCVREVVLPGVLVRDLFGRSGSRGGIGGLFGGRLPYAKS